MASRIVPLLDRVLVRRAAIELKTAGGILLPETSGKVNEGVVAAVGPGARNREGNHIPISIKVGDKVLLPDFGGQKIKVDAEEMLLFREEDIVAILKD
eukprot:c7774_g1_i2.p1 GENE.c7774_g1_i2~~c7774_g1_i2.p1  ORF type:complete len:115 (+),score=15.63 c7774_g1_i2:54-347(+)